MFDMATNRVAWNVGLVGKDGAQDGTDNARSDDFACVALPVVAAPIVVAASVETTIVAVGVVAVGIDLMIVRASSIAVLVESRGLWCLNAGRRVVARVEARILLTLVVVPGKGLIAAGDNRTAVSRSRLSGVR